MQRLRQSIMADSKEQDGGVLRRALDVVFGYDFFISYSQADGKDYPSRLKTRLEEPGFKVFLDQTEYAAGENLRRSTRRCVKKSSKFVVVGRPAAFASEWVKREVDEALRHNKTPVLIDVNGSFESASTETPLGAFALQSQWLRLQERIPELDGEPSDHAVTELIRSFNALRQETKRQLIFVAVAAVLAIVASVAVWQAIAANRQKVIAQQEAAIARARELAAESELVRDTSPDASALLGIESTRLFPLTENNVTLQKTLPLLRKEVACLLHQGIVNSVAFSPNGHYVATGSSDHTARVFEVTTGREILSLPHRGAVLAVAFSPDSRYLATGDGMNESSVFDATSGNRIAHFPHGGPVRALAFSPHGRYLVAGSEDNMAMIFEGPSWSLTRRLPHRGAVRAVAFSPDGRFLATGSFDNVARVFDMLKVSPPVKVEFPRTGGGIHTIAFSPNGRYVAAAEGDTVRVFEAFTGKPAAIIESQNPEDSVAFSPDGRFIVTASWESTTARVFDASSGRIVARLEHRGAINDAVFSPDSRYVATASEDHTSRIFEMSHVRSGAGGQYQGDRGGTRTFAFSPDGRQIATSGGQTVELFEALSGMPVKHIEHGNSIHNVALSSDDRYVATANLNGTAWVLDRLSGGSLRQLPLTGLASAVAFSPDDRHVAVASQDSPSLIFDASNGDRVALLRDPGSVYSVVFSHDARYVAAGGENAVGGIFEALTGKLVAAFENHRGAVKEHNIYAVAFSPDDHLVATSQDDGSLKLFEAASGKQVETIRHNAIAENMEFSPDGRYLAWTSTSNVAKVIEVSGGKKVTALGDPTVLAIAFSPDSQFVVTGNLDKTARVFEAVDGHMVTRIDCTGPVESASFSQDGKYVVTVSFEGEGPNLVAVIDRHLWKPNDLVAEACSMLNRTFTLAEWAQYFPDQPYQQTCLNPPSGCADSVQPKPWTEQ